MMGAYEMRRAVTRREFARILQASVVAIAAAPAFARAGEAAGPVAAADAVPPASRSLPRLVTVEKVHPSGSLAPSSETYEAAYDDAGRLATLRLLRVYNGTDVARDTTWSYAYGATGALEAIAESSAVSGASCTWALSFDGSGRLLSQECDDGRAYRFAYDAEGRLVRAEWPRETADGQWTQQSADVAWDPASGLPAAFGDRVLAYDGAGRVAACELPAGGGPLPIAEDYQRYAYDDAGRLVAFERAIQGMGRYEEGLSYDELGRLGHVVRDVTSGGNGMNYEHVSCEFMSIEYDGGGLAARWQAGWPGSEYAPYLDCAAERVEVPGAGGDVFSWPWLTCTDPLELELAWSPAQALARPPAPEPPLAIARW